MLSPCCLRYGKIPTVTLIIGYRLAPRLRNPGSTTVRMIRNSEFRYLVMSKIISLSFTGTRSMKNLTLFSTRGQQQIRAWWDILLPLCFWRVPKIRYHCYVVKVSDKLIMSSLCLFPLKSTVKWSISFRIFPVNRKKAAMMQAHACVRAKMIRAQFRLAGVPIQSCFVLRRTGI